MPSQRVVEAVILAAGEGTRLRPLTYRRPKVLIPVANRAFLARQLDLMAGIGISRVGVVVGHKREVLEDWLARNPRPDLEVYTCLQSRPRGTGDAINAVRDAVEGPFLALNGDVILDRASLARMVCANCTSVAAKEVSNPRDYGVFKIRNGYVQQVAEKANRPPSSLANVGSYVFQPDVFDWIARTPPNPKRNEIEITDTLQGMIDAGVPVRCYRVRTWYELGKPWDVLRLNEVYLRRLRQREGLVKAQGEGLVKAGSGVWIGKNSVMESDAKVIGPCVIGKDCRIEGKARIGPYSSVGDGSVISGATVEGSVLMERCAVQEGARIGYSVLGPDVLVGRAACLLDRDPRGRSVRLRIKDAWLDSRRRRLGSILGDGVIIGEGAVLNPGVMLDPEAKILAKAVVNAAD